MSKWVWIFILFFRMSRNCKSTSPFVCFFFPFFFFFYLFLKIYSVFLFRFLCTPKTGKDYGYFVSHSNETTGRATLASFLLAVLLSFVNNFPFLSFLILVEQNQLCHSDSIAQKRRWVDWDWRDMSIYDPASKTTEKEGFFKI